MRKSLPHEPPLSVNRSREIWFLTICCEPRKREHLTTTTASKALLESVRWRHEHGHWYAHLFLLMPDHCHALLSFREPDRRWAKTIRDWKHWVATQHGIQWQLDFFDHRVRRDESFAEKYRYILENPVRAGLVPRWEDWPHQWTPSDSPPFTGLHR